MVEQRQMITVTTASDTVNGICNNLGKERGARSQHRWGRFSFCLIREGRSLGATIESASELFRAQRFYRIDQRGAIGGKKTGDERGQSKNR